MAALSGCETFENYEFGDGTRAATKAVSKIVELKESYCSETDTATRDALVETIRKADPDYSGVCGDG